jgi:hypothetical protein
MATSLAAGPSKVTVTSELDSVRAAPGNIPDNAGWTYTGPIYTNGTGAGNVDRRYLAQATITASGSLTINLSSFLDSFNNSGAFLRVKSIYVELTKNTAAVSILVGGAASNQFVNWITPATAQVRVRNGMVFFLGDAQDAVGYVVTPTTGDQLKITNEDAGLAAAVNVWLLGCSA